MTFREKQEQSVKEGTKRLNPEKLKVENDSVGRKIRAKMIHYVG